MKDEPSIEIRKATSFRQAEGIEKMPSALKWGELDKDLRLELWNVFHGWLESYRIRSLDGLRLDIANQVAQVLRKCLRIPVDEALGVSRSLSRLQGSIKEILLGSDYGDCLELIQTTAREFADDRLLLKGLEQAFAHPTSAYAIAGPPPTIVPKGLEIEGRSTDQDLKAIGASPLKGALAHLLSGAAAINRGEPRDSIREAIHAVESAAKQITGQEKATLPDALKLLEREKGLHPALREALSRLYGYTSDEKGIRHALLESDNKDVGTDEALFMFSACAAFVSFLARKFPDKDVAS